MTASARFEEPTVPALPPRLRRPLAAAWISLALHAAVIALVQVVPPSSITVGEPVIEARLMPVPARMPISPAEAGRPEPETPAPPVAETPPPNRAPVLMPSETVPPLPVAKPSPSEPPAAPAPVAVTAPAPSAPVSVPVQPASPAQPAATPLATFTTSVDLNYYSARELDVQPRALRKIQPDYPADADRAHVSGNVRLLLKLEADGRVSDVEVVSATPPEVFDESARKAFAAARFSAAQKNGKPVRARVLIEVEYDWDGRR